MNLSAAKTTTTVEFDDTLAHDEVVADGQVEPCDSGFSQRVSQHLNRVRRLAEVNLSAKVHTENSFPMGAGFASSASGLAALTKAATAALELSLSEQELSVLARQGSGSACRSIPNGFVEWFAAETSADSFAVELAAPDHWAIADVAVIVSREVKKISSTLGHRLVNQSPFLQARLQELPERLERLRQAIQARDFHTFGQETETEAITLHTLAMTSPYQADGAWQSGVYYWTPDTLELLLAVQNWRADGLPVYYTLDAGPTVHLMCPADQVSAVTEAVKLLEQQQSGRVWETLISYPAAGAHVI